jgi:hypothetical protein
MALLLIEDGRIIEDSGQLIPQMIQEFTALLRQGEVLQEAVNTYVGLTKARLELMQHWVTTPPPNPVVEAAIAHLTAEVAEIDALTALVRDTQAEMHAAGEGP